MAVDGWGNGFDDPFSNPIVTSEIAHFLFVVFGQPEGRKEVFLLVDMICLDNGREDGKPVLGIERGIKIVAVDASYFLPPSSESITNDGLRY